MQTLDESTKPPFSAEEIRILGSLMEKQLTTPNNYPLTINSLMLACNQKTSREPLMNLKEGDVGHIARSLIEFGWLVMQNSGRAQRVEHKVQRKLNLTQQQQAVLAVLMLRRPQTLNELKLRTERMAEFKQPEEIRTILEGWLTAEKPLVIKLPPQAGQREERYYHTLSTESFETLQTEAATSKQPEANVMDESLYDSLLKRIEDLERRLDYLESSSSNG
ncbi:MAG: YceH family protein [Thiolinea sp.]